MFKEKTFQLFYYIACLDAPAVEGSEFGKRKRNQFMIPVYINTTHSSSSSHKTSHSFKKLIFFLYGGINFH